MPRQNRVTPFGEIVATPQRGTFMGNRGRLHDERGRILRDWQVKRWLLCALEFRGRKRLIMAPNRYTELFFLDEATGLAAGHRPCAECRHRRYLDFREAWLADNRNGVGPERASADHLDACLHADRLGPDRCKRTFRAKLSELPDGVIVSRQAPQGGAYLLWRQHLHAWSPAGYASRVACPRDETVEVLTPRLTVAAIQSGYAPEIHPTASAGRINPIFDW
jgi:hypothetical protein